MSVENNKKKIVVFDRFDWNANLDPDLPVTLDLNGEIDPEKHEVVARANDLGRAAAILLAIKDGDIPLPDVIVLGSVLEGEFEYEENPPVMRTTNETLVRKGKKRLFSRVKDVGHEVVQEEEHHILLPIIDEKGKVTLERTYPTEGLPARHVSQMKELAAQKKELAQLKYRVSKFDQGGFDAGAGYALSHLADHLLNQDEKKVRIIGHSSFSRDSYGKNAPLDAFVSKGAKPGTLQAEIDREDD